MAPKDQSLELSARVLTQYVLYRNVVIEKLKKIDKSNSEADIHKLIIPMRTKLAKDTFHNDLFTNNAWLLDDKYMSYSTILSDRHMGEVLENITVEGDEDKKEKRPDIAIIFFKQS